MTKDVTSAARISHDQNRDILLEATTRAERVVFRYGDGRCAYTDPGEQYA